MTKRMPLMRAAAHVDSERTAAAGNARERLLAGLPVRERQVSLNGVSTAVLEGGDGPPIVLLHGPGAYAAQWLRIIPDLVPTHRVIAPDLPGHGASGRFDHAPDIDSLNGWLDDLIECTSPVPPVLLGHTLGGALAARFAGEQHGRLAALVLVDTLGLIPFQPTPAFGQALNEFLSAPDEATHDRLWSQCVFDLPAARTALGARWASIKAYNLDRVRAPGGLDALRELMELYGVPAIPSAILARIAVPTTLIWGRQDRATALSVAEEASARFGWHLQVIDDAADDPALEQPEAFLSALRTTLEPLQMQEVSS